MQRVRERVLDRAPRRHQSLRHQHAAEDAALSSTRQAPEAVLPGRLEIEAAEERVDETLAARARGRTVRRLHRVIDAPRARACQRRETRRRDTSALIASPRRALCSRGRRTVETNGR